MAFTSTIQTSQYSNVPFAGDFPVVKQLKDPNDPEVSAINTIIDVNKEKHPTIDLKSGAGLTNKDQIESALNHPKLVQFVGELKGKDRILPKRKNDNEAKLPGVKKTKLLGGGLKFA